ncbi:hypothetical protein CO615_01370 [Lysobacteraceae bacterium NML75-0749]|nr:hypothetical protein CO615_01370 [Xanthomonadaceae bacterium NML75-0749]PJK04457.1 hypothetical protein CO609_05420 [Xanthomonadaceae bacterium NML91-0268]PJK08729.1 hypothetical protein CO610_04795 [Xanthomonadaceae bacterium NML95-0200]
MTANSAPSSSRRRLAMIAALLLLGILGYGLWRSAKPEAVILQGQMEAEEIDIAPKISGRVAEVLVQEGQQISVGTPLLRMDSPELEAKLAQAEAAHDAALAVAEKAAHGARPQEVEMARANARRAQAAAELAQKSWQRVARLADEGLLSAQKRDEALANYQAARDQAQAAQAQYSMARAGSRSEDQKAANAQAAQVAAVVREAEVARAESQLQSPVAGQVAKVLAKRGEINPQGVPAVTVVDLSQQWLVLNVRETQLSQFAIGAHFHGRIPALPEQGKLRFTVFQSQVLPDFATWRATRSDRGFDVRSFEIKARPDAPIPGMRPGMSVLVEL